VRGGSFGSVIQFSPARFVLLVAGIVVAIVFGKEVFGGYARNIVNPALVGPCFVYICFPVEMTAQWLVPYTSWPGGFAYWAKGADAFTRATPLAVFKSGEGVESLGNLLFGYTGGLLGETSALLIILGGIYMLVTRTENWRITVGCLLGVRAASLFYGLMGSQAIPGPPIGMLPGMEWGVEQIESAPGCCLLKTTDGLPDARDAGGDTFGRERLKELLLEHRDQAPDVACERIVEAVTAFTGRQTQEDDVTVPIVDL